MYIYIQYVFISLETERYFSPLILSLHLQICLHLNLLCYTNNHPDLHGASRHTQVLQISRPSWHVSVGYKSIHTDRTAKKNL